METRISYDGLRYASRRELVSSLSWQRQLCVTERDLSD